MSDFFDDIPDAPRPKARGGAVRARVQQEAERMGVPMDLVDRVLGQESGWAHTDRAGRVKTSPAGAKGLFQVMPGTGQKLGYDNLDDIDQNIRAGLTYIKQGLDESNGDTAYALTRYHAGPRAARQYARTGRVPKTSDGLITTDRYVRNITRGLKPTPSVAPDFFADVPDASPEPGPPPPQTIAENEPAVLAPVQFYGESPEQVAQNRQGMAADKVRQAKVRAAKAKVEAARQMYRRAKAAEAQPQPEAPPMPLLPTSDGSGLYRSDVYEKAAQAPRGPSGEVDVAFRRVGSARRSLRAAEEAARERQKAEMRVDRAALHDPEMREMGSYDRARETEGQPTVSPEEQGRLERVARTGWLEYLGQIPKGVVTGAVGTVSGALEGVGVLSTPGQAGNALMPLNALVEGIRGTREAKDTLAYQAGKKLDEWTRWAVGSNPDLEQEFLVGKGSNAVGSMASFLLGGWATKSPKLAATVLGGLSGGAQVYEEVKQLGGTEDEAQKAALIGMGVLGPLEIVPVSRMLGRLNSGAGGQGFRRAMRELLVEAGEESLQEGSSEALTGLVSGKRRSAWDILEAAAIGGIAGSGASAAISGINAARARSAESAAPPPAPEAPETLRAQFQSALDPESPRAAVLVTPGENVRAPKGFHVVETAEGVLHVSREKANALGLTNPVLIEQYVAERGVAPLIGKVAPVEDTSQGAALRTEDATGTELSTSIVPTPEAAEVQAEVDRAQFPQAAAQTVLPAQEAVARREAEALTTPGAAQPRAGESQQEYLDRAIREAEQELAATDAQEVTSEPSDGRAVPQGKVRRDGAAAGAGDAGRVGVSARPAPVAAGIETKGAASPIPDVAGAGGVSASAGRPSAPAAVVAPPATQEQPRQFEHVQFGRVTEEGKAGRGRVKVVDEAGESHVIRDPKLSGRGNERAVPVRQGIRITPKVATAPAVAAPATPVATQAAPLRAATRPERGNPRTMQYEDWRAAEVAHTLSAFGVKPEDASARRHYEQEAKKAPDAPGFFSREQYEAARLAAAPAPTPATQQQGRYTRRKKEPKVEAAQPDAQPTPAEARASVKKEKVSERTGLTETQTDYLAGELKDYAERNYIGTESYPTTPSKAEAAELLGGIAKVSRSEPLASRFGKPETIKVPGDGTFTVSSVEGANRIHQKITGKPIEGLPKSDVRQPRAGTPKPRASNEANTDVEEVILAYGSPQKAHAALLSVYRQLTADPEAAEQMGGDRARMEGLINELSERLKPRPKETATYKRKRGPYKMAKAKGGKSIDALKAADFTDLVPTATVKRDGHLLEVNAEGHEILRRAFEQNLIRAGQEEGPAESAFDGAFINREQVRETVRSLKDAAREMRESGYDEGEAAKLDAMAADLISAAREGKGTAVAYLFDYAIPHEEFHRAGYVGAVSEMLSQRHANFTALASHPAIQKAWDTYFNRVEGYARTDEALLVEETAAWIAGGKAGTLGLTEDEAVAYLDRWFESYAERNGDEALLNFAETGLTHVREIIGQVRTRRADRSAGKERVQAGGTGVRDAPQRPQGPPRGDTSGATEGQQGQVARRALPETLREQGLAAADELYEIYPDKAATADAKKLLEDLGFEASVRLLESDIQHGAEHVQLSKILQRALLAEASNLAVSNPTDAAKLRTRQQELASALSARMTRGGQFIRGAQVLDSSAEDVMATAAKVAKERGRKLTTQEAERIHAAGEELEQATASLEVSAREVAAKRREAEGVEEAARRAEEGALTKREIESLRKRLASLREKEKRREASIADLESQIPKKSRKPPVVKRPRQIAAEALGAEEAALLADLQASFGGAPLMMARAEGGAAPQGQTPKPLDKPTLDKLARLGALRLLRAERGSLTVEEFKRSFRRDFPQAAAQVDEVHAGAVRIAKEEVRKAHHEKALDSISRREGNEDLTREELEEIAAEEKESRRRAALVQAEHERALKAEGRKVQGVEVRTRALAQAIAAEAKTDEEALAAARLAVSPNAADVKAGGAVLQAARKSLASQRELAAALKSAAGQSQAEVDQSLAALQQARRDRAAAHQSVARELERIRKGKARQIVGEVVRESKGVMIALQASGDVSNLLRQGGIPAFMQPQLFPEFAAATLKSVREAGFAKNIDSIEQGPDFALKQRMGIDFAFAGGKSQGEEFFEGADVLQRIPIVKQTVGRYVQKSDEVFGGGLDHLRSSLGDLWIGQLRSQGVTYAEHPEAYKAVGGFINIITGRADIGEHNTAVTRALLSVTKLIGFSPRYRLSRIQFLTLPFNASFYQAHPAARRIVYKNVARYYATLGGTLGALSALGYLTGALAVGFLDPEDDEWLKVKIGDLRLDLTSGNQTQARTAFRLVAEGYRGVTGEVTKGMAAEKTLDIAARWLRSGADPRASLAADWWTGETFVGEPFKWGGLDGAIATRLMPISAANVIKTAQKEGPGMAVAQGAADFVGVGSQVYPDRADEPKTKAERLAARFAAEGMKGGKPRTEEIRRKLDELKGRARKGEDVRAEVEPLVASGEITEGHGESIVNARTQTLLQEKFRQLSLEDARHVLKYATQAEREAVADIVRAKALNDAEKKSREERKRANPAKAEADRRRSERAKERKKRKQEVRYGREVSP